MKMDSYKSNGNNTNGNNSNKLIVNDKPSKPTGNNDNKLPPVNLPKPLVARISLWTTMPNGKLTKINSDSDNSNNSSDEDDDDDDDDENEYRKNYKDKDDLDMDENGQLEQRLNQANLPEHVRKVTIKEMQKLRRTPSFMSDYTITRNYLELIADLPWNHSSEEIIDLKKSRRDLDNDHYGMQKLKERVLQFLAVRKLKQQFSNNNDHNHHIQTYSKSSQPILMFVGPPGTGKTSIAQSIAKSLGRKFHRISLGGISDQSAIRGHRRTYVASMPGRIIQGIKQVGVDNPVFLFDEIDKMSSGPQGDPSGALLEVLDPEQNHTFTDHYLNLAFDLSKVLFIGTANSIENIPAALLDRMEVIAIAGYTHDEKFNIARRHLIPKQIIENGLKMNQVVFRDDGIHKIITNYAREAGVRTLERRIAAICRVVAVHIVEMESNDNKFRKLPIVIDSSTLENFLGPIVYDRDSCEDRSNIPGVAVGLAWTSAGGEITFVESEIIEGSQKKGSDNLILTGQLGSVMRESAILALNWIRANFHLYDLLPKSLGRSLVENTVHIHFPAGAVGKDGPSAGVTIVISLLSLCSNLSIVSDLAMTGEITLRGIVLKVGGVKSKVLAAHRAGIRKIILPAKNESDLSEVSASIKEKMKFYFVNTVDEVIKIAFDNKLTMKQSAFNMEDPSAGLTSKL